MVNDNEDQLARARIGFKDIPAAINMRTWLLKAVEDRGAKAVGGGFCWGVADIEIELDGYPYILTIKPLKR